LINSAALAADPLMVDRNLILRKAQCTGQVQRTRLTRQPCRIPTRRFGELPQGGGLAGAAGAQLVVEGAGAG
jgi:hypothetical protein